jgi:hypothetical protein
MSFPSDLVPTSRAFNPGNWPVKTFNAMDGAEVRILYGSKRTKMELKLGYENISDENAERFLAHYDECTGTFVTFTLPARPGTRGGWTGSDSAMDAVGNKWRYAEPPSVTSVRVGRSSVTINLVGVF